MPTSHPHYRVAFGELNGGFSYIVQSTKGIDSENIPADLSRILRSIPHTHVSDFALGANGWYYLKYIDPQTGDAVTAIPRKAWKAIKQQSTYRIERAAFGGDGQYWAVVSDLDGSEVVRYDVKGDIPAACKNALGCSAVDADKIPFVALGPAGCFIFRSPEGDADWMMQGLPYDLWRLVTVASLKKLQIVSITLSPLSNNAWCIVFENGKTKYRLPKQHEAVIAAHLQADLSLRNAPKVLVIPKLITPPPTPPVASVDVPVAVPIDRPSSAPPVSAFPVLETSTPSASPVPAPETTYPFLAPVAEPAPAFPSLAAIPPVPAPVPGPPLQYPAMPSLQYTLRADAPTFLPRSPNSPLYIPTGDQAMHILDFFLQSWKGTYRSKRIPEVCYIYGINIEPWSIKVYNTYKENLYYTGMSDSIEDLLSFHGTRRSCRVGDDPGMLRLCNMDRCNLCMILKTSYKVEKSGSIDRPLWPLRWGYGIYSAPDSSTADHYSRNHGLAYKSPLKAVLVNTQALGRSYVYYQEMPGLMGPPPGYTSVIGRKPPLKAFDEVYTVYRNDAIRPAFLVMYRP